MKRTMRRSGLRVNREAVCKFKAGPPPGSTQVLVERLRPILGKKPRSRTTEAPLRSQDSYELPGHSWL
jgi:hypothetical protein